jgi:WhiB family redox-sensing transcriptional regulator
MGRSGVLIELLADRPHWWSRAACHGLSDLFFATDPDSTRDAQAICGRCPVRAECAQDAAEFEKGFRYFGVRGGLTATQRKRRRWRSSEGR